MRLKSLTVEKLELAAPMWRSLHEHHAAITSHVAEVAPPRTAAESWASRREFYERWLQEPGGLIFSRKSREKRSVMRWLVCTRTPERVGISALLAVNWKRLLCFRSIEGRG